MFSFLKYLVLGCTLLCQFFIVAQKRSYLISGNIGTGLLIPHHSNMRYLVQGFSPTAEIIFEERNADSIHYGLAAKYMNSGNQQSIGNIYGGYGYISLPLSEKMQNTRFVVGLGFGYVEKIFDKQNNIQNIAIGSHYNAHVSLRLNREIFLSEKHLLNIGIGVTHYSNGSYQTPNLGLNYLMVRMGLGYFKQCLPGKCNAPIATDSIHSLPKFNYNISISTGLHENVHPFRGKYPIVNVGFRVYPRSKYSKRFVTGIDGFYNPAIKHTGDSVFAISPFQSGLFIGTEFNYKKLAIGIEMGGYVYNENNSKGLFYHRFSVNYNINHKIKTFIQLKSHWAVAEALEIGINYQLK